MFCVQFYSYRNKIQVVYFGFYQTKYANVFFVKYESVISWTLSAFITREFKSNISRSVLPNYGFICLTVFTYDFFLTFCPFESIYFVLTFLVLDGGHC